MADAKEKDNFYEPIFVARQPVFDREQGIFAYELLFRHSGLATEAMVADDDTATSQVIADGFGMALDSLRPEQRVLINFPESLLLKEAPLALPKEACIVEILETVRPVPGVLRALQQLKEAGYTLALDDFIGRPGMEPLLELADIVKVEVLGQSSADVIRITQGLGRYKARLLAEKVEDDQMFRLTRTLGYDYFQGFFFSRPELVEGRKLPTGVAAKVRLLRELADPDYLIESVAGIISRDTGLSYRLLKYLNSAAFYRREKVESLSQAVVLLGRGPLKQWLMAVVISDLASSPRTEELTYQSVQRGRFLELLHQSMRAPFLSGESMFLLGLFSRLDTLLGQSMKELSEELPLDDRIVSALTGEQNPARDLLSLVESVETGEWDAAGRLLKTFSLDVGESALDYARASTWAREILDAAVI